MRRPGREKAARIRALAQPLDPVGGRIERVPAAGLFVLIRAEPRTRWLPGRFNPTGPPALERPGPVRTEDGCVPRSTRSGS